MKTLRRPGQLGFTLIEMLVVLMIMGLLLGLVSVSAAPDDKALLRVEVERMAQLMDLAANESRLGGGPIAWTGDAKGYRFWRYSEASGWVPMNDDVLRPRRLPDGMSLSHMQVENLPVTGPLRVEFNAHGAAPSFRIEMAFGKARHVVANSPIGEIRVLPEMEHADGTSSPS